MVDAERRAVYSRLILRKLVSSKVTWVAGAALLVVAGILWIKDSNKTAFEAFLGLSPYFFLFLTQDMIRGEVDSGSLENVLFVDGGYKTYLLMKNRVVCGAAAAFISGLAVVLAVPMAVNGTFPAKTAIPLFLMALVVGIYFVLLGNTLSLFLKGGSNAMIVIVAQTAVFVWQMMSLNRREGFLAHLETGAFPDFGARLGFMGIAAVIPNLLIQSRFVLYGLEFLLLAAALWGFQRYKIGRLELERR